MSRNTPRLTALLVSAACLPGLALASGYSITTHSASAQSTANANGAEATDASVIFSNPAGMLNLPGTQVSGVISYALPDVTFTQEGTATGNIAGLPFDTTITGSDGGDAFKDGVIPHFYMSHRLNEDMAVGLGVFVPFGAKVKFSPDYVGRYYTVETELTTLTFNPSFAIKADERNHFGIGLNAMYLEGNLVRMIYGPSVAGGLALDLFNQGQLTLPEALAVVNNSLSASPNGELDPRFKVEGDSWGFGFNVGYMHYFEDDKTRIGLAYRSSIKQEVEGEATLTQLENLTEFMDNQAGVPDGSVSALATRADGRLMLRSPESFSVSVFHQLNPEWALMADWTWTGQDRLQEILVEAQPITTTSLQTDWQAVSKLSLGASWQMNPSYQWRFGYMYDEAPIPSDEMVLPSLPDNDRQWFSLGGQWQVAEGHSLDFAYSYIYVRDRRMDRRFDSSVKENTPNNASPDGNGSSQGTVTGTFDSSAQVFGVQWNMAL